MESTLVLLMSGNKKGELRLPFSFLYLYIIIVNETIDYEVINIMRSIDVYRTHVELTDYTLGEFGYIEKQHSIYDKVYHRWEHKGMIYDKDQRKLMLPRGVDIDKMRWMLETVPVNIVRDSDPYEPMDRKLGIKYSPRDEDQKAAIRFIMGMNEYYYTKEYAMLSLNLNTGKGKSYCAIASLALKGIRTIIITDTVGCLEQWYNFFQQYTDISTDEICWISPNNVRRLEATCQQHRHSVYLALHSTLRAYAARVGWQGITSLFHAMKVGVKVYDEAHLDLDNMFRIDCYTNTYLNLYLTATPNRSSYEEDKVFQEYFKGVPMIDLFHQETDPHTKYAGIKFNSHPTAYDISNCKNAYGLDRMGYVNYLVEQPYFHYMLHVLINQTMSKPGKSLWYIGTNNGIAVVYDWILCNYPELAHDVGLFYGEIPKDERRAQLDKKIILTNTKSSGAAIDIPDLREVICLAEPFKSRVLAQQTFGRCRAKDTIYKDIVDTGFIQTKSYYNFKKPIFKKYATECVEVRLKDQELKERAKQILLKRAPLYTPFWVEDPRPDHQGEFLGKHSSNPDPDTFAMEDDICKSEGF